MTEPTPNQDDITRLATRLNDDCVLITRPGILFGRTRVRAQCVTCNVPLGDWTIGEVRANFERHKTIPAPPAEVLARPIVKDDIRAYPDYFISGRGRRLASVTLCPHDYYLTDSCPGCDADQEAAEAQ
jgi:hypothetical protein